jgi:hypothetical protein
MMTAKLQNAFKKLKAKELVLKEGIKGTDVNEGKFVLNVDVLSYLYVCMAIKYIIVLLIIFVSYY